MKQSEVGRLAIHQSGEDYLETILVLQQKKGQVRSIDVAYHLGYSKPSVSRAVSILKASGHLTMEPDGSLLLTESGRQVAEKIYTRHRWLTSWLIEIGVSPQVAAEDACRIEHHLSSETFECLKRQAGSEEKND